MANQTSQVHTSQVHRVLACRPEEQNKRWVEFLQSQGLQTLAIPLLEITPLESLEAKQGIKNCILELDSYDSVIFISQNAVNYAFDWIEDFWPQLPVGLKFFAIGEKTAKQAKDRCSRAYPGQIRMPEFPGGVMDSESLLALPDFKSLSKKKLLIFKGVGGRHYLQDSLIGKGALVGVCELYERSAPANLEGLFENIDFNLKKDIFVVFSGETMQNLDCALASHDYADKKSIPLVVPGSRVKKLAEDMAYEKIYVSENATEKQMWKTLQKVLGETPDIHQGFDDLDSNEENS